ncbi:putative Co/Zn/Cd efflux system membrane fusion protein [Caenispirillum salinarum AK4]|uniref:Putative Co/Zn/Cd efflux system membrane fusion protein n=1 Tax=Caenispirillum salinarum AK4 TaxID=1238182 RepID=K9GRN8_9PROT|nr:efflux RND transporter periplasmic adaptor subunit [Caenispirillum salinarum]EKV28610.1 putative Co/Zn/Cd efflux system membrane fusion protein [Caenispirillum salinarum AK4]
MTDDRQQPARTDSDDDDRSDDRPARRKRIGFVVLGVAALALVAGGVWWFVLRGGGDQQQAGGGRPPVTVTAETAATATWQPWLTAVGTLNAYRQVQLTSEVPGQVEGVYFESGASVSKGEVLVQLQTDQDEARLADLRAELRLTRQQLARQRELAAENFASEAELDQAQARFQSAQAKVNELRERLDEKSIKAPFSGELGIRRINEGAYVQPGQPIVALADLDPLRVIFSLPQQQLAKVETGQTVEVRVSSYPDAVFTGTITAIDPVLSERTRTFTVEARIDNADRRLRPGMFGDVRVILPERADVVTLPQTALSYNPYGDFVFVIREKQRRQGQGGEGQPRQQAEQGGQDQGNNGPPLVAERRFVTAGERRGTQIAIEDGVEVGERVATSGLFKLQDGTPVRVDNSITVPSRVDVEQVEY